MSQRDLVAELHGARIAAPAHVREHVRQIVAGAPVAATPLHLAPRARGRGARRRGSRRRRPDHPPRFPADGDAACARRAAGAAARSRRQVLRQRQDARRRDTRRARSDPAPGRVSRYGAFLSLRVDTADGVSNGVKRALQVATVARRLLHLGARVHRREVGDCRPDPEDSARPHPGGDHPPLGSRDDHGRAGRRPGSDRTAERRRPHDRAAAEAARNAPCRDADRRRPRDDRRGHRAHRAAAAAAGRDACAPRTTRRCRCTSRPRRPRSRRSTATVRCTGSASRSTGSGSAPSTRSRSARRCCCCRARLAGGAVDPPAAGRRAAQPAVIRAITRNVGSPTGSSENSGLTQPRSGSTRLS